MTGDLALMKKLLEDAHDHGFERLKSVQESARIKKAEERAIRKRLIFEEQFSKLPKLLEDAIANGEEYFEFLPIASLDIHPALGSYKPRPDTDAELIMELLNELNLIAEIEGNGSDTRDIHDAHVKVQARLFG